MSKRLTNVSKIYYLIFICAFALVLTISIPSLARYKNRLATNTSSVWDGTVATKYRKGSGTQSDPYVISNGSELAYFASMLETTDYQNTYFALNNNIILNNGVFEYDTEIKYNLNGTTYHILEYTNEYFDESNTKIGSINLFDTLDNFKGHLNGNSYSIYGLYLTSKDNNELALFTNLGGTVENLYVENALVYGGYITSGIASSSKNANIKNVLYNGYVIGNKDTNTINITNELENQNITIDNTTSTSVINLTNENIIGEIESIHLTGNLNISDEIGSLTINDNEVSSGEFDIILGNKLLNLLELKYQTTSNTTYNLTNLKYIITYKQAVTSGIVAIADNTNLVNIINKANVKGSMYSAGLVGLASNNLTINQAYNTGNISSDNLSGGLIGKITNGVITISNSYNIGTLTGITNGGLIASINDSENISITNTFNASNSNYIINSVNNSNVEVKNSYCISGDSVNTGTISGKFNLTNITNLKDKNYLINTLNFNEFDDTETKDGWIFEEDSLPILYIDDINNPVASINVGIYSWNNLSNELNNIKFDSTITFKIEELNNLKPIKEVYYYVNKSNKPLNKTEVETITDWNNYQDITQITEEGIYVIYAKVVDYNDNIYYLNTDLLILDMTGAKVNVTSDNYSWNSLKDNPDKIYINNAIEIAISAIDDLSGVASIQYYLSDSVLTTANLDDLGNDKWINYNEKITFNSKDAKIIYVKVVDNCNYITYVNSDYIVYSGYELVKLSPGYNTNNFLDKASITDKSSIALNFKYMDNNPFAKDDTHNLITNVLLPKNTKLILIDNINNKTYTYQITSEEDIYGYNDSCNNDTCVKKATYPFKLFKEVGNTLNKNYTEISSNSINEDYTLIIDFKDTSISNNYEGINAYLEIKNGNNLVRTTLENTKKTFNVCINSNASLEITSDYKDKAIIYNSDSSTDINISTELINKNLITDTNYENQKLNLSIKLVDNNNNLVNKDNLKNLTFKLNDKNYYPDNTGIVRINLSNEVKTVNTTLTITTSSDNIKLEEGNYSFKIGAYTTYDDIYSELETINELTIPVKVENSKTNSKYLFDVLEDNNKILNKPVSSKLTFNIIEKGKMRNPNIRVSLYKKNELTAYNQDYTLIDLLTYIKEGLEQSEENKYYVTKSPITYKGNDKTYNKFELTLLTSKLESNSYKLVFDLYDGSNKVGSISKTFIVR